jgi:hypothetical protein
MLNFYNSIKKTIHNFDEVVVTKEKAIEVINIYNEQFVMQEETWGFTKLLDNTRLWNTLIDLIEAKFPEIVE